MLIKLLELFAFVLIGGLAVDAAARFDALVYSAVLGLIFLEAWFGQLEPVLTSPLNLYPADIVMTVVFLASLIRLVNARALIIGRIGRLWLFFIGLQCISLIRGANAFGLREAGLEFREQWYFYCASLYAVSWGTSVVSLRRLAVVWRFYAFLFVLLAVFRWLTGRVSPTQAISLPGEREAIRVLTAGQAFILAEAFIMEMHDKFSSSFKTLRNMAVVSLLGVVFLTQHRSVWVVMVVILLAFWRSLARLIWRDMHEYILMAVVAGVSAVLLWPSQLSLKDSLVESITEPFDGSGSTISWRYKSWNSLLMEPRSAGETLLGKPYGSGFEKMVEGRTDNISPHNHYVYTFLRVGLTGLLVLIVFYMWLIRSLSKISIEQSNGITHALVWILVAQLIFCVPYGLRYEQGLLLGFAISYAGLGMSIRRRE